MRWPFKSRQTEPEPLPKQDQEIYGTIDKALKLDPGTAKETAFREGGVIVDPAVRPEDWAKVGQDFAKVIVPGSGPYPIRMLPHDAVDLGTMIHMMLERSFDKYSLRVYNRLHHPNTRVARGQKRFNGRMVRLDRRSGYCV